MKKRVLLLTVITVVVLLVGTVVGFAVSDGINNQDAVAENTNTPQPEEAPITFKSIDEYEVKPQAKSGSKAEKILLEVLSKKNMTEIEVRDYNATPEDIKELTYEQAREKQHYYYDLWLTAKELNNTTIAERAPLLEKSEYYKWYANAIAVEQDLVEVLRDDLLDRAMCARFE